MGIRGADLDGSNAAEPAWLYNTWLLTGFKVDPFEFMGSFLALDLSHQTAISLGKQRSPLPTTLGSSYPNPFNGSTLISYTLAAPALSPSSSTTLWASRSGPSSTRSRPPASTASPGNPLRALPAASTSTA